MGLHSLLKLFCPAVTLPGASELRRGKKPLPSEQQTGPVLYPSILELGTHSGPQVPSVFVCLEELTPPCGLPHARLLRGRVEGIFQVILQVPPHVFTVLGLHAKRKLSPGPLRDRLVALEGGEYEVAVRAGAGLD